MTDLETQRAMFDRAGVVYDLATEDVDHGGEFHKPGDTVLSVRKGDGPRQGGSGYFVACLHFTPEGALRGVSAWE